MLNGAVDVIEQELLKTRLLLQQKEAELKQAIADIDNIAYIASHDLKTPVNNVISLAHLVKEQYSDIIGEEGAVYINYINESSYYLSAMISGIHGYSKAARLTVDNKERVRTAEFITSIIATLEIPTHCTIQSNIVPEEITIATAPLKQILLPILLNAIQYNDKVQCEISISVNESAAHYIFEITDNGEGIAEVDYGLAFELFKRLRNRNKDSEHTGLGLAIARRLAERMTGVIAIKSELGTGSSFTISIPK